MNRLINKELGSIKRVATMLCMGFGDFISIEDKILQYSLHIQCPYRFILNNKLILASYDMSFRFRQEKEDAIDNTMIDKVLKKTILPVLPLKIIDVSINHLGDIYIKFNNGLAFETFIDSSMKVEHWRLSDETKDIDEDLIFINREKDFGEKSKNYFWLESDMPRNFY